jgi:hypothetical protein
MEWLHNLEEEQYYEMENNEGEYRKENGQIFAFIKNFLKH